MELATVYSGESVVIPVDLDTSVADTDYALTGTLAFTIGTPGDTALGTGTVAIVNAETGTLTVTLNPVPDLADGVYPWQLTVSGGQMLTDGTITIASRIGDTPAVEITVGTDTYVSVADADSILALSLDVDAWRTASADDKARALATATRIIDSLRLVGMPFVVGQTLAFPRIIPVRGHRPSTEFYSFDTNAAVQTEVPDAVIKACALEAAERLAFEGSERLRLQSQGVTSISSPTRSENYGGKTAPMLSVAAMNLMRPYVAGSAAVR